jgi:phage terminase small subunit
MQERSKRTEITADYVLSTIKDTVERCRMAKPICDRDGNEIGCEFDASNVLRGSELLGKHLRLFTDKTEHSGSLEITAITRNIIDARDASND